LRGILSALSASTYSREHYDYQRKADNVTRGLVSIGETRFATLYWSGESLLRGLPTIRKLVAEPELGINISVSVIYLLADSNATNFQVEACQCLE
jgi:hypothetical protein